MAKSRRHRREESSRPAARNSRTTVSGPAEAGSAEAVNTPAGKLVGTDELSVSLPINPQKASEYEPQVLKGPEQVPSVTPHDPIVGAIKILQQDGRTRGFLKNQYRHCKPLLALTVLTVCCRPMRSARCSRPANPIPSSSRP